MILVLTTLKLEELKENSTYGNCKYLDSCLLSESLYLEYSESVSNPDHLDFMVNMEVSSKLKSSIKNCKNGCLVYRVSDSYTESLVGNIIAFVDNKCNNVEAVQIYDNPEILEDMPQNVMDMITHIEYHPNI
jgi:hypothetical protein